MKAVNYALIALTIVISTVSTAAGQVTVKAAATLDSLISVEFDTSRPQLVAGEGLGTIARIRNNSKVPVYIKETSFALTVPLELEGQRNSVNGYAAFFPTEVHSGDGSTPIEEYYKFMIKLDPGDTYSVFWTNTFTDNNTSLPLWIFQQVRSQFQFLFFTPGKYSITLTAKYWTDPKTPDNKYRTLSKDISVLVVAPLFVILFGAAMGGLFAHFVLPQAVPHASTRSTVVGRSLRGVAAMFGSILLSIVVTIILSRVSEAKFLVSITVNDVWGAVVVGFVANYFGYKVLASLLPKQRVATSNDA